MRRRGSARGVDVRVCEQDGEDVEAVDGGGDVVYLVEGPVVFGVGHCPNICCTTEDSCTLAEFVLLVP